MCEWNGNRKDPGFTKPEVANSQGVKKNVPVEILQPEQDKDCKDISSTASADFDGDSAASSWWRSPVDR